MDETHGAGAFAGCYEGVVGQAGIQANSAEGLGLVQLGLVLVIGDGFLLLFRLFVLLGCLLYSFL